MQTIISVNPVALMKIDQLFNALRNLRNMASRHRVREEP